MAEVMNGVVNRIKNSLPIDQLAHLDSTDPVFMIESKRADFNKLCDAAIKALQDLGIVNSHRDPLVCQQSETDVISPSPLATVAKKRPSTFDKAEKFLRINPNIYYTIEEIAKGSGLKTKQAASIVSNHSRKFEYAIISGKKVFRLRS